MKNKHIDKNKELEKKRHLELEKRSQYLRQQNKRLFDENPKEFSELSKFRIRLSHDIFWRRRKEFALLMEKFVNGSIEMEDFETEFSLSYHKTFKTVKTFQKDLKKLERFQLDPRSSKSEFSRFIVSIFRQFEVLEDEECSEEDVKELVKNNLLLMQPYLE